MKGDESGGMVLIFGLDFFLWKWKGFDLLDFKEQQQQQQQHQQQQQQASKQANKQTNKQTSKQANKQTSNQATKKEENEDADLISCRVIPCVSTHQIPTTEFPLLRRAAKWQAIAWSSTWPPATRNASSEAELSLQHSEDVGEK